LAAEECPPLGGIAAPAPLAKKEEADWAKVLADVRRALTIHSRREWDRR
jgi:hypothetical protein